jgi:Kdo2-lipid IVA lauroyltransferase/acyltransferase
MGGVMAGMFRKGLETLGLALGFALVPWLPRRFVVALANALGDIGYRFSRRDRILALWNLNVALGHSMDVRSMQEIARASFRTFALLTLDLFWFSRRTRERVARYVVRENSFSRVNSTRPCILITAHFGNWEVMGLATAIDCGDVLSVVSPLSNAWADRILNAVRKSTGQEIVPRRGAVRAMLAGLRAGKITAMLPDQNTVPRDGGVFVDFFGLPVPVSRMPAALRERTNATILPVFCAADADGTYHAWALEPVTQACENGDETGCMQKVMNAIEGEIRKRPGAWLWMYRRWKYVPAGADAAMFPPYSRGLRDYEVAATGRKQEMQ